METARTAQSPAMRSERRAQRRQAAQARAAFLGQHFELGELVISAEKTPEPAARTVGCMALVSRSWPPLRSTPPSPCRA